MTDKEAAAHVGLRDRIAIRPIGIDELSAVRYVHASSFKATAQTFCDEPDLEAFVAYVRGPEYSARILASRTIGAWLGPDLIGTISWEPVDHGTTARFFSIFVHPLFMRAGVGAYLMDAAEADVIKSGLGAFMVRAPLNTIGFFEQQGYLESARGACGFVPNRTTPFALMTKSVDGKPHTKTSAVENPTPRGP